MIVMGTLVSVSDQTQRGELCRNVSSKKVGLVWVYLIQYKTKGLGVLFEWEDGAALSYDK